MFPPHISLTAEQISEAVDHHSETICEHPDITSSEYKSILLVLAKFWYTPNGQACVKSALKNEGHSKGSMEAFFIAGFALGYEAALTQHPVHTEEVN